jgi:hypothetical protein
VFPTREHYWYDPFDPPELRGWHLGAEGNCQMVTPDERSWLWSPALQLWVGHWEGTYKRDQVVWLRFYDQAGQLALTSGEAAEQHAEVECARAEAERARVEAEHIRANAAEAEVARSRDELAQLPREDH